MNLPRENYTNRADFGLVEKGFLYAIMTITAGVVDLDLGSL